MDENKKAKIIKLIEDGISLDKLYEECIGMTAAERNEVVRLVNTKRKNMKEEAKFYEFIKWIEDHQNKETGEYKLPRRAISKNGRQLSKKEMTEEEIRECKLRSWWENRTKERNTIEQYKETEIEDIPEEYRNIVIICRKLEKRNNEYEQKEVIKLVVKATQKKSTENPKFYEYIKWIEDNQDKETGKYKVPRYVISKNGKILKINEMTEEEIKEYRLGSWWNSFPKERNIIEQYKETEIENIPEEYRKIVMMYIKLNIEKRNIFNEFIEWIKEHTDMEIGEYKLPRYAIFKDGKKLKTEEMTPEEVKECRLRWWWENCSKERKIIEKYSEEELDDIPEEFKEIIVKYREVTDNKLIYKGVTFNRYVKWIENHQNKETKEYIKPRVRIKKDGKILINKEMTDEEKEEYRLANWWQAISTERIIIYEFQDKSIEDIPEEYRKIVLTGRRLGLEKRNIFNEYIEWLRKHQDNKTGRYKLPRVCIHKNGKILSRKEMTEEEKVEVRLGEWWNRYPEEKEILNQYKDITEEEFIKLPEQIREFLLTCNKYGIKPECKILQQLKKCVRDNVETNDETRSELAKMMIEYNRNDIIKNKKSEIIELIQSGIPKELIAFEYQIDIKCIEECIKEIEELER